MRSAIVRDVAIVVTFIAAALLGTIDQAPFSQEVQDGVKWVLGGVAAGAGAVVAIARNGGENVEPPRAG